MIPRWMLRSHIMRAAGICLIATLLWPLTLWANDVDVPELGIKLTQLPSDADKPQLTQASQGSELTTHVGAAMLTIFRDSTPVPAGSDVADPGYRATLDARFDRTIESKSQGAPTAIGGHSGWTVVDTHPGQSPSTTVYTCVSYVIVDQHLYRLTVRASSSEGRPHEFDSLVGALSSVKFEDVHPSLPASQSAGAPTRNFALNRLRAGRDDRQDDVRGMRRA
jgi:hypothetical protein